MCGEKFMRPCLPIIMLGSPPRMRGKADEERQIAAEAGITPACAGKSAAIPVTRRCGRDHPRMCGEKIYSVRDNIAEQGSPPHVRGKEIDTVAETAVTGITPAYAGKSRSDRSGAA